MGGQPAFAFLNLFDVHDPYTPSAPYDLLFASEEPATRAIETGRSHSPEAMDAELGRLFGVLRDRGALDRTIVIVTSDHGEEFGEDGHLAHGNDLHFPSLHVPLIIHWPPGSVPAGVNVRDPVSLTDLPRTILDLAGLGRDGVLPGTSLRPHWGGEPFTSATPILSELYWVPNQSESYPVARGDLHSLVRGRFQFISGPGGQEQLFDIIADPLGLHDLVNDAVLADTVDALRRALAKFSLEDRAGR